MSIADTLRDIIVATSDFICGYPLFILLIGGGLFLFLYSGAIPLRRLGHAIKSLGTKSSGEGQISSFQALMSTISSTVGMGNIAGVAIAIYMGGPGAIFWMWVSALFGMATKFFEGTLAIMYRGRDENGDVQGGPMYVLTEGISPKMKPLAKFFCFFGLFGCLCVMQANQLVEAVTTVVLNPLGIQETFALKLAFGIFIGVLVGFVVVGGISRISAIATKIVPTMVGLYFLLVFVVIVMNFSKLPGVFVEIVSSAFNLKAGFGALAGIAVVGARRAMYVNEAGVGTASIMHGSSRNDKPVKEGLIAMLGPMIDSGFVCTLTAIPILMSGVWTKYAGEGIKGLTIALDAYETLLPGIGSYLLIVVVTIFAFSTMFSYSYYGVKCTAYLFGEKKANYYKIFYLLMLVVACLISLDTAVSIMDMAFALMAVPTMISLFVLCPKAKAEMKRYFAEVDAKKAK